MVSPGDPLCYVRHLVMGLRVAGSFPYWWGRSSQLLPNDLSRFSVVLFLWSIFTRLVIISRGLEYHTMIESMYSGKKTSEILNMLSIFITTYLFHFGSIITVCVSPYLARLLISLEDLHSDQHMKMATSAPHKQILKFIDHRNVSHICSSATTFMLASYDIWIHKYRSIPAKVTGFFNITIIISDSFIFLMTYKEILNVLGQYIKRSTSWAVEGMSGGANKLTPNHTPTGIHSLFHLERQFVKASTVQVYVVNCSL